jgi:hypothetical protein
MVSVRTQLMLRPGLRPRIPFWARVPPALADIPDQKGWRISISADYGR